jgi:aspartate ammonia-lyase
MNDNTFRTETDSMGEVKVAKEAYFGAFTTRALENFCISGETADPIFISALTLVKKACAHANFETKAINEEQFEAITKACDEILEGKFDNQFPLDIYQAGAGTSYNMNCNEVIANRANEMLGAKVGEYTKVHPNNHVNASQSTNDVIPTATRLAIILATPFLLESLFQVIGSLETIAKKHKDTLKVGRTHTQDAVPITLGQEFDSYAQALRKSLSFIEDQAFELKTLGLGGTAVGTGINTDKRYKKLAVEKLGELVNLKFKSAENLTEIANNMNAFLNFSASLRSLAINLLNLASDLKLMSMGPKAGLMEITLPPVQPGSSIMPGKVNPSILECLEMICVQVQGNDKVVELSAQKSQFELNTMCPIIMTNIMKSLEILTGGLIMLKQKCLDGITINEERISELYENSLCTATALAPALGYNQTADIVKTALKEGRTIKEEVLKRKLLSKKELDEILDPKNTTQPK